MNDPLQMQQDEKLILIFRKHWFVLFQRVFAVVIIAALPFAGFAYLDHLGAIPPGLRAAHAFDFVGGLWFVVMWWALAGIWTKYYLEMWAVTDRRLIRMEQIGFFSRDVTVWGIERILEASVHTGNFIETFLKYGTLEIQTAGPVDHYERIHGVPQPDHVRETIMAQASRVGSLEATNRNQEQLLHTISHEVKSYLTKDAASLAYIAEGGNDPEKIRSFAQTALSETRKGVSAVIDLLSGSDAKSGTIQMTTGEFDLKKVVEELFAAFKPVADRKDLIFTMQSEGVAYMVRGDKTKLRDMVLRNIIDNALRYTSHGSVAVKLEKKSGAAIFSVADTGVGISAEDMKKLFTAGGKGEHSHEVNPESTGFGLHSAKQFVEAHGGTIAAHSDGEGHGSVFTVTLPLAR
jgi:signal transduction histidine kinase